MKLEHFGMAEPGDCRVVFTADAAELEQAITAEQAAANVDPACRFGLWAEAAGAGGLEALLGNLPRRWQRVREDRQAGRGTPETHALERLDREMKMMMSRRM